MIRLRVFGEVDLRSATGGEIGCVLRQPKRLGLLTYLAVARPQGLHRRDELLALFWPDVDEDRARNGLNKAVQYLRAQLGEEALEGRGSAAVGINRAHVWCDAAAFELALAQGRLAEGLDHYGGELLPAFHVDDAPDFGRWLDVERNRLRMRASEAAWALSAAAERDGMLPGAIRWLRHVVAWSPTDERSVRRLLELLDASGDRSGAVREYDAFARRLEADYELEPSPETRGLVNAIRARRTETPPPPMRRATADRAAPLEHARDPRSAEAAPIPRSRSRPPRLIAVLPFAFRGRVDLSHLGDSMVDVLAVRLPWSRLRVVDPQVLLSLIRREATVRDPTGVGTVAEHFGADCFVMGSVLEAGGRIEITATLYDADATLRHTFEAEADSPEAVLDAADALARKILAALEDLPVVRTASEATVVLSAFKAYLEGETDFRAGRLRRAGDAYGRAVAADPGFSLAWLRISLLAAWSGNAQAAAEAAAAAQAHLDRLPQPLGRLLTALLLLMDGCAAEAEDECREYLRTYPDSVDGWFLLGINQLVFNPLRGCSGSRAREAYARAESLDPENATALISLAYIEARDGRLERHDELLERIGDDQDFALWMQLVRAAARRDRAAYDPLRRAVAEAPDLVIHEAARYLALLTPCIEDAVGVASILTDAERGHETRVGGHVLLAYLETARGRAAGARLQLDAAERLDPETATVHRALLAVMPFLPAAPEELAELRRALAGGHPAAPTPTEWLAAPFRLPNGLRPHLRQYLVGLISARLGDHIPALRAAASLDRLQPPAGCPFLPHALAQTVRSAVASAKGDRRAALSALESARLQTPLQLMIVQSPFHGYHLERYLRAELLAAAGRLDEAVVWWESVPEASIYGLAYAAPSYWRRGRLQEQLGRPMQAMADYQRVVDLWSTCDARLAPVRDDALRQLARLGADPTSGRASDPLSHSDA